MRSASGSSHPDHTIHIEAERAVKCRFPGHKKSDTAARTKRAESIIPPYHLYRKNIPRYYCRYPEVLQSLYTLR